MQSAPTNKKHSTSYGDLERRAAAKNIPLYAHLDLTYRCNLKCVHCYAVNEPDRQELTTDEVKDILDQLAEAGTLYLAISGGEAMLRKDYFDIISHAKSKGFALRLFTNGTLITEGYAKKIAEFYPLFVEISIYAMSEDIHDGITQIPGSFARTMSAIHHLIKFKMNVHIKTIVMKQNINELRAIQEYADFVGAKFLPDPVINPKANNDKLPLKYRLETQDIIKFYKQNFSNLDFFHRDLNETICSSGKIVTLISPFGDVYPCVRIQQKAGNLRQQPFREIWSNSLVLKHIRELTLTKLKHCATCDDMDYCSPCPGLALMEHGSLYEPAKESCRHASIRKSVTKKTIINYPIEKIY